MKNLFLLIGLIAAVWLVSDIAMNKLGLQFQPNASASLSGAMDNYNDPASGYAGEDDYSGSNIVLKFTPENEREERRMETVARASIYTPAGGQVDVNPQTAGKPRVVDVNRWVDRFTSVAFLEAQKKDVHVPATLSLATGLYLIKQGADINSKGDYVNKVIDYLLEIKNEASTQERKTYFQYAANTDYWLQGMERRGIPTGEIRSLIKAYNLGSYDDVVFEAITKKQLVNAEFTRVETKADEPVFVGDVADKEAVRKHVATVNRWAEKELSGTGHDMQFVAAKTPEASEVEKVRHAVTSLEVGESMVFDDPNTYELAVRELVAFENGFTSWKSYYMDQKYRAKKQFQKRSNLMAKGMKMRVTRRK